MNQRIKELAEQCGFRPQPSIYDRNQSFDIEKFAELIVRECDRYACSAWEHGPLLGRDLLIHFGIVKPEDN
jgi:hypothetical protein